MTTGAMTTMTTKFLTDVFKIWLCLMFFFGTLGYCFYMILRIALLRDLGHV
jgi:hypothetical protein